MAQTNYVQLARQFASRAGIDPNAFVRQIQQESSFNPNARSPAGAQGIAQIMPGTARAWGVNPGDPVAALRAAALHMAAYQKQFGSLRNALVAYNAGPGAVGKALPAETRDYVAKIAGGSVGSPSPSPTPSGAPAQGNPRTAIALSLLGFGNLAGSVGEDPLTTALMQAQKGSTGSPSPPQTAVPGGPNPFLPRGAKYSQGRVDQGRDFSTNPGGPVVAPGAGKVLAVKSDPNGFGPSYPIVQFTSGPFAGKTMYIGHTLSRLKPGQSFRRGDVVSVTGTSGVGNAHTPGWAEIGYAPGGNPGRFGQAPPF